MSQFNPAAIQAMNAIEQRRRKQQEAKKPKRPGVTIGQEELRRGFPNAQGDAQMGPPAPAVTRQQLQQGFPTPAQRERNIRDMGPPTPAQATGPMPLNPRLRPMSQMGPPTPAESTGPMPRAAAPAAAPAAAQPAQRRAANPMMGPPDQYASRVQAGAQEFRTRRAEQDSALTARGIDPAAAREEQFINRAPDTRAMVLRAATLRARGQGAAADRMIEEVRQINQSNRVEGLERQALRNPERAGSAPAIDRIARRQQQERALQETDDALFTDANAIARVGSNTALTEAMRGRVNAETGYRSAVETQEGRIGLESQRIDTDMSGLQVQEATNQARMRILEGTTDLTVEQLAVDLDSLRARAPLEVQTQLTAAQTQYEQAQTGLERAIAMRTIQSIVGQIEVESAAPIARAQAGAAEAGFNADIAASNLARMTDEQRQEALKQLAPAERAAALAKLQAEERLAGDIGRTTGVEQMEEESANEIRAMKVERANRLVRLGVDPLNEDEVETANYLTGGEIPMVVEQVAREFQDTKSISPSSVTKMETVLEDLEKLRRSSMSPEAKAGIAREMLQQIPQELPELARTFRRAATGAGADPMLATAVSLISGDARRYTRIKKAHESILRELNAMAK